MAEPLVPEPIAFEVKMAIEQLKRHKSPRIDQVPAELIKEGGRTICSEIHFVLHAAVLLEKLTGSLLVKKIPAFYGTRRFITAFTRPFHLSLS